MFESSLAGLDPILYEAIIAALLTFGLLRFFGRRSTLQRLRTEIETLTRSNDSLSKQAVALKRSLSISLAVSATAAITSFFEIVKLKAKARRANQRAGRAEQRAAQFRRKLYRRTHNAFDFSAIRPVGVPFGGVAGHASRAAALGTLFHNLIERNVVASTPRFPSFSEFLTMGYGGRSVRDPLTGFAMGGKISPTGRRVPDALSDLVDRTMRAAAEGRSTLRDPYAQIASVFRQQSSRPRWDGHTSNVEGPESKPLTVADIERALSALPGSVQVVAVGPDGRSHSLAGAEADSAVASVFRRKTVLSGTETSGEKGDIGVGGLTRSDFESTEARILADVELQRKIDAAEPRINPEHAPDTGDGGTVLGHEAMVRAQKFDARVEAEACDTQRPSHDRQVPRFSTRPTDPFEYSDRSPRAG